MAGKKVNIIGLESTAYRGAKTTLCAGCGHNAITERIIDSFFELGHSADRRHQAVGHRLLEQESRVLPRTRRTASTRCTAACRRWHGRGGREPQDDRDRHQRRRRHGRDRHRPVRASDATQPADRLHHRGQRLLRPDEGAVLADGGSRIHPEDRRHQRPAADRHLRAGHRARRVVCGALVFG